MKICNHCRKTLPLENFNKLKTAKDGLEPRCRLCASAMQKEWKVKNMARHKKHRTRYVKAGGALRDSMRRRGVHITPENSAVLTKRAEVEGCEICGLRTSDRALALDHDHKTKEIRGLLCRHCNTGLGLFRDDPTVLQAAINYLQRRPVLGLPEVTVVPTSNKTVN